MVTQCDEREGEHREHRDHDHDPPLEERRRRGTAARAPSSRPTARKLVLPGSATRARRSAPAPTSTITTRIASSRSRPGSPHDDVPCTASQPRWLSQVRPTVSAPTSGGASGARPARAGGRGGRARRQGPATAAGAPRAPGRAGRRCGAAGGAARPPRRTAVGSARLAGGRLGRIGAGGAGRRLRDGPRRPPPPSTGRRRPPSTRRPAPGRSRVGLQEPVLAARVVRDRRREARATARRARRLPCPAVCRTRAAAGTTDPRPSCEDRGSGVGRADRI